MTTAPSAEPNTEPVSRRKKKGRTADSGITVRTEKNTVCFTGHRVFTKGYREKIANRVREQIYSCYYSGIDYFFCGGALGFDTLCEQIILTLRDEEKLPIHLCLAIPCENQTAKWPDAEDIAEYNRICSLADETVLITKEYDSTCMMLRNKFMVDSSSMCIAYYRGAEPHSGTMQTVKMAEKKGIEVINVAFDEEKYDSLAQLKMI